MKTSRIYVPAVLLCATTLAGCGETALSRGVSGAGIGAGAGAGVAALMSTNPWTGAIVGASVLGLGGVLTAPEVRSTYGY